MKKGRSRRNAIQRMVNACVAVLIEARRSRDVSESKEPDTRRVKKRESGTKGTATHIHIAGHLPRVKPEYTRVLQSIS
jgi:hypothetical protein